MVDRGSIALALVGLTHGTVRSPNGCHAGLEASSVGYHVTVIARLCIGLDRSSEWSALVAISSVPLAPALIVIAVLLAQTFARAVNIER